MSHHIGRLRWPLVAVLGLLAAVAGWHFWGRAESSSTPAPSATAPAEPVQTLPPAAHLRIPVVESTAREEVLLDPDSDAWNPIARWVPSQNGFRWEWPHRHSENGRLGISY